jgi:hypothetical protein
MSTNETLSCPRRPSSPSYNPKIKEFSGNIDAYIRFLDSSWTLFVVEENRHPFTLQHEVILLNRTYDPSSRFMCSVVFILSHSDFRIYLSQNYAHSPLRNFLVEISVSCSELCHVI